MLHVAPGPGSPSSLLPPLRRQVWGLLAGGRWVAPTSCSSCRKGRARSVGRLGHVHSRSGARSQAPAPPGCQGRRARAIQRGSPRPPLFCRRGHLMAGGRPQSRPGTWASLAVLPEVGVATLRSLAALTCGSPGAEGGWRDAHGDSGPHTPGSSGRGGPEGGQSLPVWRGRVAWAGLCALTQMPALGPWGLDVDLGGTKPWSMAPAVHRVPPFAEGSGPSPHRLRCRCTGGHTASSQLSAWPQAPPLQAATPG